MVTAWSTEAGGWSDLTATRESLPRRSSRTPGVVEERVLSTLNALKVRVRDERLKYVKSQLGKNCENLQQQLREVEMLSKLRDQSTSATSSDDRFSGANGSFLIGRQMALFREDSASVFKNPQICSKLMVGNSEARKVAFMDNVKMEAVGRLPSYTAWMFVDRNERMARDQSIAGRRRISYESNGKETFFCIDTEEDADNVEETEYIYALSDSEQFILRRTVVEHGIDRVVLQSIADFLQVSAKKVETSVQSLAAVDSSKSWRPFHEATPSIRHPSMKEMDELLEGYEDVHEVVPQRMDADVASTETELYTTLALALDSFDTLFCRRCLVFNCALHPCFTEILTGVNEIQLPCVMDELDLPKPCSPGCRFVATFSHPSNHTPLPRPFASDHHRTPSNSSCAIGAWQGILPIPAIQKGFEGARRISVDGPELDNEISLECGDESPAVEVHRPRFQAKRVPIVSESLVTTKKAKKATARAVKDAESSSDSMAFNLERKCPDPAAADACTTSVRSETGMTMQDKLGKDNNTKGEISSERCLSANDETCIPSETLNEWNRLEKDLCEKGIQIFGKNSCLIARNILKGCKSCQEIAEYMNHLDMAANSEEAATTSNAPSFTVQIQARHPLRRKNRFGRKKAFLKSALGSIRKRIGRDSGELNFCREYAPCTCESRIGCGKDCPCVLADMHCEKYCGCFKVCKNRFRGCQCAKSMCDRRNCPCFAAGRECDPDLCKFCRIECGHSSPQACYNMRILQRKKQRLLLAHSNVCTGWGIFTRHSLRKNDYIGEYTGELISHSEADRRGRVYDRETSFLFNLNDKLVVDAFRKGNKLKFANHSARKPNCYAKVLLVGGDHRVGIFAKEKIDAGEELLYDYQYEPEIAPVWAMGPD